MDISKLSTERLLAFKRKHFPSEQYPHNIEDHVHDCDCDECKDVKKNIAEYKINHQKIIQELKQREHVQRRISRTSQHDPRRKKSLQKSCSI